MTLPSEVWAAAIGAIGGALGYLLGRKQEADRVRIGNAFPHAEAIATLIQQIHASQEMLIQLYAANFTPQLQFQEAMERFEQKGLFAADRKRVNEVFLMRADLREKIRVARVYLNPGDMDRIDEYLRLGDFTFESDGMGGVLFDNRYRAFFSNLLDKSIQEKRAASFKRIKARFNKMHQLGWFS